MDPATLTAINFVRTWTWNQYRDALPASSPGYLDVRLVERKEYFGSSPLAGYGDLPLGFVHAKGVFEAAGDKGTIYSIARVELPNVPVAYVWAHPACGLEVWALVAGMSPAAWRQIGELYPSASLVIKPVGGGPNKNLDPAVASEGFNAHLSSLYPAQSFILVEHRYYTRVESSASIRCAEMPPPAAKLVADAAERHPGTIWIRPRLRGRTLIDLLGAIYTPPVAPLAPGDPPPSGSVPVDQVIQIRLTGGLDTIDGLYSNSTCGEALALFGPALPPDAGDDRLFEGFDVIYPEPMSSSGEGSAVDGARTCAVRTADGDKVPCGVVDVNALSAWAWADGTGVRVAVVDTSVNETIDVTGVERWPAKILGDDDMKLSRVHGHGTMVAALIAGRRNKVGYVGVAPGATIVDLPILDGTARGESGSLALAIHMLRAPENPVDRPDVIVLALEGRTGGLPDVLACELNEARKAGILVIAAAGNRSECINWPAAYEEGCVAVTAIGRKDELMDLRRTSGRGKAAFVCAPGYPTLGEIGKDKTAVLAGTSASAAYAAGVAAIAIQANPAHWASAPRDERRVDWLRDLLASAVDPATMQPWWFLWSRKSDEYGYGFLDATRTLPRDR